MASRWKYIQVSLDMIFLSINPDYSRRWLSRDTPRMEFEILKWATSGGLARRWHSEETSLISGEMISARLGSRQILCDSHDEPHFE